MLLNLLLTLFEVHAKGISKVVSAFLSDPALKAGVVSKASMVTVLIVVSTLLVVAFWLLLLEWVAMVVLRHVVVLFNVVGVMRLAFKLACRRLNDLVMLGLSCAMSKVHFMRRLVLMVGVRLIVIFISQVAFLSLPEEHSQIWGLDDLLELCPFVLKWFCLPLVFSCSVLSCSVLSCSMFS